MRHFLRPSFICFFICFIFSVVAPARAQAAKLRLSAEYDYASGDRGKGKHARFDTLFGMRRADFGPDGIYSAVGRSNISTTGIRDVAGRSGQFAGHQIEGRLRYWLVPKLLRGEINAMWLSKGQFLRTAPNALQTGNTHYLATGLTATF